MNKTYEDVLASDGMEEEMWKNMYELMQNAQSKPLTEHEERLQDADGGFFEKFGFMLRQKSHREEENLITSLAPFREVEAEIETEECGELDGSYVCVSTTDSSVCNMAVRMEYPIDDSDEDGEKKKAHQSEFIENALGMNIDDLYEEILFEICNNIGCDNNDVCSEVLIEFAQEVFKISNDKHVEILAISQNKEPPKIRLNVEIIKAENLMPKDPNGLSDPFVTLYLEANGSHRYNSSVKRCTLNPIWEEHFSLPISDNPRNEALVVEVWDFDEAETVKEKVNKIFDVKGVKGLRKLMKEIALTASTGKHDNELIGRSAIPLKSIPVSGLTVWYNLEKGSKTKSRGAVLVKLALSAEKNKRVGIQEHRHLLKLLLMHELDTSQVAPFWWSGKFQSKAEAIRSQHAVQSDLSNFESSLSQWTIYATIHENHPLSFTLFNKLLDTIVPTLKSLQSDGDDMKTFWDGAKRILPSCFSVIRKLRAKNVGDKHIVKTLCEVLDIIGKIKDMEMPEDFDLFPKNIYGWIENDATRKGSDLDAIVLCAIHASSKEWLEHIIDGSRSTKNENSDENELQHLIKVIQMIRADLQRAMEYFDRLFYNKIRFDYSSALYKFYDVKLAEVVKSVVMDVCSHIKRLDVPDDDFQDLPNIDDINMGTTLFELYLILKRFLDLGKKLCGEVNLSIQNYHIWFMLGVTHWLDISLIKALNRIEKAIELDHLKAVDETVKYSSSAVDTLAIFYQIKIFWEQLEWPDVEGSYTFVAKIVDDICRCCVFYAQRMSRRVEHMTTSDGDLFQVSNEWCLAINNIDYIRQSLRSFVKELGIDDLITRLGEYRSTLEAERCAVTIENVIENAVDTQKNQILELIDIVARKMAPPIRRFLVEGAEVLHEDSNSMEKLMMYLDGSLRLLFEALNEVNFGRILDAVWTELSVIMYDLIQSNLEKRRPPAFFQNLRQTLHLMVSCFKIGNFVETNAEILAAIEKTLDLHAFETADLIHQYYLERLGPQMESETSEFGQLTIKASFTDSSLILNIMNARNLKPMDTNGACDAFVKAHFLPTNRFGGVAPVKTAVQHKTRFPLYDEEFTIKLTDEQRSKQNSLILFSIKDKDLFGMTNQYIAECYITFADILGHENEQIHLTLSRPVYTDSETVRALELRQGDKQAKEFVKKLKNKTYA